MRIPVDDTVVLRSWQPCDREALAAQANDRRVWINLRDRFPHPYSVEDANRFIAAVGAMGHQFCGRGVATKALRARTRRPCVTVS